MKKLLLVLVAGLMATSLTACGGAKMSDKELIVGAVEMNGYFMPSEGLGNSSYDKNIRDLIHGYSTVAFTAEGEFEIDKTVVKESKIEKDANGDTVYTFTLNDLKWNDGTPVTSDDYLFSALLAGSPEFVKAKAQDTNGENFVGYKDYHEGKTKSFKGIKKIDEKSFSFTIAKENLPYFWELNFVKIQPFAMKAITGGNGKIVSDENGTSFDGDMTAAVNTFANEYRNEPKVSSGPYKFVSFKNKQVRLEANENFAGDYKGEKPKIKTIIVKEVNQKVDMDALINGEVHILNGVVEGQKIENAKANKDKIQESTYSRNGYGNVPMHTDFGPTKEKEVRHAIAYILDKQELVKNILGGYGSTLNSDYSTASWVYQAKKAELDKELVNYSFSIDKANEELDNSSYKFEKDGTTKYDAKKASKDYLRYNAKGEVLQINHLGTQDNVVTDTIELQYQQNMPKVGIKFTMTRTDFPGLMDGYYYAGAKPDKDRKYHTFNMAVTFSDANDPYYSSYACEYAKTPANPTNTCNEELDAAMKDLRRTDKADKDAFAEKWVTYEKLWNELLPVVPVYANQYYDFASSDLEGFKTTPYNSYAQIICELSWK